MNILMPEKNSEKNIECSFYVVVFSNALKCVGW